MWVYGCGKESIELDVSFLSVMYACTYMDVDVGVDIGVDVGQVRYMSRCRVG